MTNVLNDRPSADLASATGVAPVGDPVAVAWRESTLTRAEEMEALCVWLAAHDSDADWAVLATAVRRHIEAARQAARGERPKSARWYQVFRTASLRERAMSNLDAAEAQLLNFAPPEYVLGQIPSLLRHVQCHLSPADPRRLELERIALRVGVRDGRHAASARRDIAFEDRKTIVEEERGRIVTATRAASSAALREQVRVRSFRNLLVATAVAMTILVVGIALAGWLNPTLVPLCFAPEESGRAMVVCPTAHSAPFSTTPPERAVAPGRPVWDIDDEVNRTASPYDLLVVVMVGLTAAAVSAATAIRGIKGSSERYGVPVALAALKLPTGAVTAFLGLLLMRGQFVPGLSALDTSAQILAWAIVFGYAQQAFTRLVDRQGQSVLDSVRGADRSAIPVT